MSSASLCNITPKMLSSEKEPTFSKVIRTTSLSHLACIWRLNHLAVTTVKSNWGTF
jgi:hypothetical protein